MLWDHTAETLMYVGIGLAIGLFIGAWFADKANANPPD